MPQSVMRSSTLVPTDVALNEGQAITTSNAREYLYYEAKYKVLGCLQHCTGIRNLRTHLRDAHTGSVKDKAAVVTEYAQYELTDPREVEVPVLSVLPFKWLGPPILGHLCDHENCGHISINLDTIRQHCRKTHGWRWHQRKSPYWRDIYVQTFFKTGGFQRYFAVQWHPDGREPPVTSTEQQQRQQEIDTIQRQWEQELRQHQVELEKMDPEVAKHDRTGWFNRTRWPQHLVNSNLKDLAFVSRGPDRDERHLLRVAVLILKLLEQCVAGLDTLHRETRRWLRSAQAHAIDSRPITRLQNADSQVRYGGYLVRFLCYTLRVRQYDLSQHRGEERPHESRSGHRDSETDPRAVSDDDSDDRSSDDVTDSSDDDIDSNDLLSDSEHSELDRESGDRDAERAPALNPFADASRLFPWRDQQAQLAAEMLQSLEDEEEEKQQLARLLALCASFIFQTLRKDEYESGWIHFLAVLGINEEMDRLRTANDFSYRLAGVVYDIRMLAVEWLLPAFQREEQGPAELEHFLQQRQQFLADGGYSPMSTMISLLAYAKSVALDHGNAGAVSWSPDNRVMALHGRPIVISRFRQMVQGVITDAEDLLWQQLLWMERKADRFAIPLDLMEDDLTFSQRGFSFIHKPSNGLDRGLEYMLQQMQRSSTGQRFRHEGTWHSRRVRQHLRLVERFQELLLLSAHFTGTMPARGSEILSVRGENGLLQDRNLVMIHGSMAMVIRYYKSQSQWDIPKVIPRFLAWRVGQLMALYLAYVRPFAELLSVQTQQGGGRSEYIWGTSQGPWETARLTKVMTRETAKRLGTRLTTHDYRHVAVSIGRRFIDERFAKGYVDDVGESEEPEIEEDGPLELSCARSGAIGTRRYGVASDIVRHLSVRSIDVFRSLAEQWHEFLGLRSYSPRPLKRHISDDAVLLHGDEGHKRPRVSADGLVSWGTAFTSVTPPRQSLAGCQRPSSGVFGSESTLVASASPKITVTPRPTLQWEHFTTTARTPTPQSDHRSPSRSEASPSLARRRAVHPVSTIPADEHPPQDGHVHEQESLDLLFQQRQARNDRIRVSKDRHLNKPSPAAIHQAMQHILGQTEVAFRSREQEQALNAVLQGETPLVVVLPTGGGKSLLFLVPAYLERTAGMTIVVVPYVQLMKEVLKKARAIGINCIKWQSDTSDPATLVVVSAEHLVQPRFLDYAGRMREHGSLRRVFVDEGHLALTAHSWRPPLAALADVRCLGVPTIFLTATLPPVSEKEFEDCLLLQTVRYIRANTARVNTRYYVYGCVVDELFEQAIQLCQRRQRHFQVGEKGVVYCRRRSTTEEMAQALHCGFFHAGGTDNEATVQRWLAHGGLIVATSALGTGVDYTGIVFVLHVDLPYGMIDFAQESGRAGRGGETVDSVILLGEHWLQDDCHLSGTRGRVDEAVMQEFVRTRRCRRAVLGRYFDGTTVCCDDGDWARCDRCGEGQMDWQEGQRATAISRAKIEQALNEMVDGCPMCWIHTATVRVDCDKQSRGYHDTPVRIHELEKEREEEKNTEEEEDLDGWLHDGITCSLRQCHPVLNVRACEQFRQCIRYEGKSHSCYKCGLSQKLCVTGQDETQACQWPGIAVIVLRMAMISPMGLASLHAAGFRGGQDQWQQYRQWIGGQHSSRIWGELMSNGMAVLVRFLEACVNRHALRQDRCLPADRAADLAGKEPMSIIEEDEVADVTDEPEGIHTVAETNEHGPVDGGGSPVQSETPDVARQWMYDGAGARLTGSAKLALFQQRIMVWKQGCVLCVVRGRRITEQHHWTDCPTEPGTGVAEMRRATEMMRWQWQHEAYTGCQDCRFPLACCTRYRYDSAQRRFRREGRGQCEWVQLLHEAACALLWFGGAPVQVWAEGEIDLVLAGMMCPRDPLVTETISSEAVLGYWLGRKMKWGWDLDSNQLCEMLTRWCLSNVS